MKILKYIIYGLLALILLFLLLGFIKPNIEYGHTIEVDKSIEEAWAVHQDESRLGDWLKGFQSIELIEGEKGTVNSKYKVVVKPSENEEDFTMIETIKSIKENDHMSFNLESDFMTFDQTVQFASTDGKTTIKSASKGSAKGIFMRSMFAMMDILGDSFQKQEEENFNNLKKIIDENTKDYFPEPEVIDSTSVIE